MIYVAIDFETANAELISACSVGLAKMEDGQVIDTFYSLIKPPTNYFLEKNIEIHGITASDVSLAPSFKEIWPTIHSFIGENLLIAHNAFFDVGILKALLNHFNLSLPSFKYTCTVQIARKVWPDLENHKLTSLSNLFGFDYEAHHALDDAINCALVFHKACPCFDEEDAYRLLKKQGVRFYTTA